MRSFVEQVPIEFVGVNVVRRGVGAHDVVLPRMDSRRRTSGSARISEVGDARRRAHNPSTTRPGRLCGRVSPIRSSRSACTRYASLAPSRTSISSTTSIPACWDVAPVGLADSLAVSRGVLVRDQRGQRFHVVGSNARDGPWRNARQGIVVEVELLLVHAEHVPAVEGIGHLARDRAEILADDRHPGRRRRRGDHGQDLLAWVVHVHAVFGREALGDPPQAVHCHRVIDPQDVGVSADTSNQLTPQPVPARTHGAGQRRREAPVLTLGEERVRWGTDAHLCGEHRRIGPHLVAEWVRSDRQVERERRRLRVAADRSELLVGEVLGEEVGTFDDEVAAGVARCPEPGVRTDVGMRCRERGDLVELGRLEHRRRLDQLASSPRGECTPLDHVAQVRDGSSGERVVVEVELAPVQTADRRIGARVVRVVEVHLVQRQRGHHTDAGGESAPGEVVQVAE